ncbi:oxygen-independent coproporphyrinogen III oxidase [Marinovum sp. SP66]|uniref:oxygen-independent coproporphyrinogen III oxidase n=1 Tax=Marinovum TaxID=367771 RepID=UPI00237A0D41|nr:oxygen-independent coproporphyrinogen III oxidase [Marinovum sp. SP66]MDD9740134.1 oxygen-independent coproporphyrinogen III oxidase [Marinovum sp. SP66]
MVTRTQLSALGLFDAKVPRYTSYPTAPHFSPEVGPEHFSQWIAEVPPGGEISLYVHVPFCRRLCWFCACRTQGTQSDAPVRAYLGTLLAELRLLKAHLPAGVHLSRLHWGGGTPTLLAPDMMEELRQAIFEVAPLGPAGEFSVEIDPNEIDAARLDALVALGLTRASIGVQDFDPAVQETIGRLQSFEVTRAACDMLRARGVASLNADILYGLPHQTTARITDSVQKLLSLGPDRVALYGYAHVPWMARRQALIPEAALPSPEARLDLFETARRLFFWDSYDEIGIDHFAARHDGLAEARRMGRLRRNFQGYTDDTSEVLIGVGASSISRFPQGYAQNAPSTGKHTGALRQARFSTVRGHVFSDEDRLRGRMIEALMCDFRIDAAEMAARFGLDAAGFARRVAPLRQRFGALVQVTETEVFVPVESRPLTRIMARTLDAYDLSRAGHSSAV